MKELLRLFLVLMLLIGAFQLSTLVLADDDDETSTNDEQSIDNGLTKFKF